MKKLPFFVVNHRIRVLKSFLALSRNYFSSLSYDMLGEVSETRGSEKLRSDLNSLIGKVELYISESNTTDVYCYRAPAAIGGYTQNIPLVQNMFSLPSYRLPPNTLNDVLERALADYLDDKPYSILRTFNPFYWLTVLAARIAILPFSLLNASGFDGNKIANSTLGRLLMLSIKLIFGGITALSGFVTILAAFGKTDLLTSLIWLK